MTEENKTTEEVVKFKDFELTAVKAGYKGKREIAESIFKEKGITPDITKKVFDATKELHNDMLDFCAERVCAEKKNVELILPVASGVTLDSKVKMVAHYPGIPKKDEDGNVVEEAKPFTKYGISSRGISISFSKDDQDHINKISSDVQSACEEFCSKMDK